jgi:hypothetical protein
MAKLTDLGFKQGVICEVIFSTYNSDGTPNAAPMGVTMHDNESLSIDFFHSTTLRNFITNKCGIINLTSDIGLFYETTFKETNLRKQLPKGWFEKLENFKAPQLKSADATIDVSLINLEEINNEKTRAICRVNRINVTTNYPMVYNRALALTLEAIIHSTRIQAFLQENRQKEAADLLALVMHCKDVVNRVGPNSAYSKIMADLLQKIDSWRRKQ